MTSARHFTAEQAREVGEAIGIDWGTARFSVEQFRAGMAVELEHGDRDPATDVTASDPVVTGKIALAHLNEFPDYYTRLARMEAEAEEHWRGMPAPESPVPGLTARDVALILGAVGATAGIGAAATTPVLESRWYRRLRKPPWQPPGAVFGPVWTVIYALIATSMLVVRRRGGDAQRPVFVLFGTNLALNLAWTLIFFRGRSPLAAGVEILVLEGATRGARRPDAARVAAGIAVARPLRSLDRLRHRADVGHLGPQREAPPVRRAYRDLVGAPALGRLMSGRRGTSTRVEGSVPDPWQDATL